MHRGKRTVLSTNQKLGPGICYCNTVTIIDLSPFLFNQILAYCMRYRLYTYIFALNRYPTIYYTYLLSPRVSGR